MKSGMMGVQSDQHLYCKGKHGDTLRDGVVGRGEGGMGEGTTDWCFQALQYHL